MRAMASLFVATLLGFFQFPRASEGLLLWPLSLQSVPGEDFALRMRQSAHDGGDAQDAEDGIP